ncbi:peroxisome assembly protein 10-A-like [Tigriopus californicus]|uniref:peroxisome assembly protein 10-A-like n=1 Tax=Tigriopus californicus TaxID=6832 RepID=UPI0027DA28E0|nr:peroxisome assembly protein 10-A-like [Tigriopus californicus]
MSLEPANRNEILRSSQKDTGYIEALTKDVSDLVLELFGPVKWFKWKQLIGPSAAFSYFAATTLSNCQTVGEEYSGIIQANQTLDGLPNLLKRFIMVAIYCYGPLGIKLGLSLAETQFKKGQFRKEAIDVICKGIMMIRDLVDVAYRLNLSLFFLFGSFYHLSKRVVGVRYGSVQHWMSPKSIKSDQVLKASSYLGFVSLALSIMALVKKYHSHGLGQSSREMPPTLSSGSSTVKKCPLCLEFRTHPAATSCGHIFCWTCIIECLQKRPECPLCRSEAHPQRVVPLQNYE